MKRRVLLTRRKMIAAIVGTWILATLNGVLIIIWDRSTPKTCTAPDVPILYGYICVALPFLAMFVTMYTLYIIMYRKIAKRSHSALVESANPTISRTALKSEKKFTWMLILVLGIFTICLVPFIIILLLRIEKKASQFSFQVSYCVAYANCGMNFIIYAVTNDEYRAAFKKILCCGVQKIREIVELPSKSEDTNEESLSGENQIALT